MKSFLSKSIMFCMFTFCMFVGISYADYIDFEGYIIGFNDVPIDKTVKMSFTIYDSLGKNQWEVQKFVTVKNGKFHTELGKMKKLNNTFLDGNYFIGVSVRINNDYQELPTRYKLSKQVSVSGKAIKTSSLDTPQTIGDFTIEGKLIVKGKIETTDDIKVGNSESICNDDTEGSIRYNYNYKIMEYCNGEIWKEFGER